MGDGGPRCIKESIVRGISKQLQRDGLNGTNIGHTDANLKQYIYNGNPDIDELPYKSPIQRQDPTESEESEYHDTNDEEINLNGNIRDQYMPINFGSAYHRDTDEEEYTSEPIVENNSDIEEAYASEHITEGSSEIEEDSNRGTVKAESSEIDEEDKSEDITDDSSEIEVDYNHKKAVVETSELEEEEEDKSEDITDDSSELEDEEDKSEDITDESSEIVESSTSEVNTEDDLNQRYKRYFGIQNRRNEQKELANISVSSKSSDSDADEPIDNSATVLRSRILQNEITILRGEKQDWVERERELLQRIQQAQDELKEQRNTVIDAQSRVNHLEQELELVTCRSKIRQQSLEHSYRTLCENVRLTEEASLKARLDFRRLQTRNMLLEELIQTRTMAYEQLENKLAQMVQPHVDAACEVANDITKEKGGDDNQTVGTYSTTTADSTNCRVSANEGTQASSGYSVSDPADNSNLHSTEVKNASDDRVVPQTPGSADDGTSPDSFNQLQRLMTTHIAQMISCSKETERQMREVVDVHVGELKDMLQQTRSELAYKTEECNVLTRSLETIRAELEFTKNNLSQNLELQASLKDKYQSKLLQFDELQKEVERVSAQLEEAKRELDSFILRERKNKIAFDDYVRDTDIKLHKMELMYSTKGKMGTNEGAVKSVSTTVAPTKQNSTVSGSSTTVSTSSKPAADTGKPQDKSGETVNPLVQKVHLLTEKLKEQVVRAYTYEQKVKELEARLKRLCGCRKALQRVNATKLRRCWCRYKCLKELKQRVIKASIKQDAHTIKAVLTGSLCNKRRKIEGRETQSQE
ncbi:uncharacterized protein BXIN_2584 [Babesia sp. Xinjiang]|uniref:uncharacterized protein n=1 Tax=Babesia sp. Xinjiang TaxID=462227 RepID=UPI000A21E423|nr:uncharacterized protein BXIN_2584 [Babesia sp. Xinjiang]ORM41507.1 hypothetical protein BXIN_2584 [Babesia sp. Xinjiang]